VVPRIALSPTTNLSALSPEQHSSEVSSFSKLISFENSLGKADQDVLNKDLNKNDVFAKSNSAGRLHHQ